MTVVDKKNYGVETLVYYYLKNYSYDRIEQALGDLYGENLKIMYESVCSVCDKYSKIFFPNSINNPESSPQNSWFDLHSKTDFAVNVKYGYESSANSRIRDLTANAVMGINEFLLKEKVINKHRLLSFQEVRNNRFNNISKLIKNHQLPEYDELDILYLKYTYLFCMNFIEGSNETNNIFFIKFMKNGQCTIFQTKYFEKYFSHKSFIKDLEIEFSTNSKNDPHKQTVKYYLKNKYIGFLELRTNKRVMLHLRFNMDHWNNLSQILESYFSIK